MYRTLFLGLIGFAVACSTPPPSSLTFSLQKSMASAITSPQILGSGFISTEQRERDLTISPSGDTLFYTLEAPAFAFATILMTLRDEAGVWSPPSIAPFSGRYYDLEPAISPDGQWLYFASNRPLAGSDSVKDFDIWRVCLQDIGTAEPENLGPNVNAEGNEFYPSVSATGHVYFTARRPEGPGGEDIYVSHWQENEGYQPAQPIDSSWHVNTPGDEFNAYVMPDETGIIFTGWRRADGYGSGDLYWAFRSSPGDKQWSDAINLGPKINGPGLDYCPFIWKNTFFYTRSEQPFAQPPASLYTLDSLQSILQSPLNGLTNVYFASWDREYLMGLPALKAYLKPSE